MRHAGPAALDRLEPLLLELRGLDGLKERSRGVFYRRGSAFLHFHEDSAGDFADLRHRGGNLVRLRVTDPAARQLLLENVRALIG